MIRPGTITRAGSNLAVRQAAEASSSGCRRCRGGLLAAAPFRPEPPRRLACGHTGFHPSPTKWKSRWSGSNGRSPHPDGGGRRHHGVFGGLERQLREAGGGEVGPDRRRQVRRASVPGPDHVATGSTQSRIADGARGCPRADVPEHPAHQDDVGRYVGGAPGPARRHPRRSGPVARSPTPASSHPHGPWRRQRGPDRARPAGPRPPHPVDGSPRRRSRHAPGPHTGSLSGSALDGYPGSRPARRAPSNAPPAAAATGSTPGPRMARASAPSANRPPPCRKPHPTPYPSRRLLDGPQAP